MRQVTGKSNASVTSRTSAAKEGRRERKRKQTRHRIIEQALKLFLANGFEATTLDAIADAADISRRTFFYYFKSKEDIVLAFQGASIESLQPAILAASADQAPLDVVRNALMRMASTYASKDMVAIDRLMISTEGLRARKQASYVQQEQALYAALCEKWPHPKRRTALRLVAMVSIGALRLAVEAWREDSSKRPIAEYVRDAFAGLKAEI
jgi:AcrR family transcriptional regulator